MPRELCDLFARSVGLGGRESIGHCSEVRVADKPVGHLRIGVSPRDGLPRCGHVEHQRIEQFDPGNRGRAIGAVFDDLDP